MTTWVLLRGLTREGAHWGPFIEELGAAIDAADLVTLDLPGTGSQRSQRSPVSMTATTDACRLQLQARGHTGRICLLGLSMGAMVAADWALRYSDEVER